jgi:predicted HTH transcriptional regulator
MDLSRSKEWTEDDLNELIRNQVQESVSLDYKRCASLQKLPKNKDEVSKDVSAFANSAGGIIVYGIEENGQVPTRLDSGYDPTDISKEWLEQVIQGNIRPRINDVHVNQVPLKISHPNKVAYVVTIPQDGTAHQAADFRYYKRFNFESVPMYDHEVKDVMNRLRFPLITPLI